MLEIPESFTIAQQLNQTIVGKKIAQVQAAGTPHGFAFFYGNPEDYPARLEGQLIQGATAVAGYVKLETQDADLLFSDGVNIRYFEAGQPFPPKNQLYIKFADGSGLVCTVQMYGGLVVCTKDGFDNEYFLAAKTKPSPLSENFTFEYFKDIYTKTAQKESVKAMLATKQRIPGLGNGSLQDILFNAKINPQKKLKDLSEKQLEILYSSVIGTLGKMCKQGGRDTEKELFGKAGGYKTLLSNKTRSYPCIECGAPLVRKAYLGGNVYFCENCQPV